METEKIKVWADILTGPFSVLVLAIGLLYVVGSYIPTVVDRHFAAIDRMMDEHRDDREMYARNMEQLTREIGQLGNR